MLHPVLSLPLPLGVFLATPNAPAIASVKLKQKKGALQLIVNGSALIDNDSIIEVNGVGSEATHVWDASAKLLPAWIDQLAHYRAAFEIGAALRARGHRPSGVAAMYRHWRLQRRLMADYPAHD